MAKEFAKRITKNKRDFKDIAGHLDPSILEMNDQKLLQGARLGDIELSKIEVRKQVRTKFNDDSIRELAENIQENGLIQPLVVHRENDKYVLICGERRFRAMSTIEDMKFAPCFILEDKSDEELMAIQFSENSAREQLHYIDQADSIWGYKKLTGASERKIQASLGISKSEVHRCLSIAKLPKNIKEAAKIHNTEKYVLLEWGALPTGTLRNQLKAKILDGSMRKRLQLKRAINAAGGVVKKASKTIKKDKVKSTEKDLVKLMKSKTKDMDLDKKTQAMLKKILKEAQKELNT